MIPCFATGMRLITWADKLKPVSAVIKDKLSEFLADARCQRAHVIRAFKSAGHMLEAAGKGFGKCYWGNRWKHVLFEHFFCQAEDTPLSHHGPVPNPEKATGMLTKKPEGGPLTDTKSRLQKRRRSVFETLGGDRRYELLKRHLGLAANGAHEWLNHAMLQNECMVWLHSRAVCSGLVLLRSRSRSLASVRLLRAPAASAREFAYTTDVSEDAWPDS